MDDLPTIRALISVLEYQPESASVLLTAISEQAKKPEVARTGVEPALPKELDPKSTAIASLAVAKLILAIHKNPTITDSYAC